VLSGRPSLGCPICGFLELPVDFPVCHTDAKYRVSVNLRLLAVPPEDEKELRLALRRVLGRVPDPKVWERLKAEGLLAEANFNKGLGIRDEGDYGGFPWLEDLVADYKSLEEGKPAAGEIEQAPDAAESALARILAAEAARDDVLLAFRKNTLRGRLVGPDEVEEWIARRVEKQDYAKFANAIAKLVESHGGDLSAAINLLGGYMLEYVSPADERRRFVRVTPSGPLADLRSAAQRLSNRYGWSPGWAATFALTGAAPPIPRTRVTLAGSFEPERNRITLDVSPRVSAVEITELYLRARDLLFGGSGGGPPGKYRPRPPRSEGDTVDLAVFVAERNDGRKWKDAMAEWNEQPDRKKYELVRTFTSAARRAYEQVTGRQIEWRGAKQKEE
jgi:predicted transcriptional regulator